jgi:hypothetical protein
VTRRANDFYETAQTRALLANQRIDGVVLEPCVGDWSIANLLRSHLMGQPGSSALVTNDVDAARVATFYLSAADDELLRRRSLLDFTRSRYRRRRCRFSKGHTMDGQKPSIGRIVIYNHPGSADGKYPPTQSPAIIQNVAADGTVRLFVFGPKGQHMDDGLIQGDGPCQWNWPPRV